MIQCSHSGQISLLSLLTTRGKNAATHVGTSFVDWTATIAKKRRDIVSQWGKNYSSN